MEVDRAVFYSVSSRAWQFLAGPVTLLLIAQYFTAQTQGYFYTFSQLMMLQTLVELGLHTVIIAVSSHEWAHLELDENGAIVGQAEALSRLSDLRQFTSRFYWVIGLLFVVGVGTWGLWFLDVSPPEAVVGQIATRVAWRGPWMALVLVNGGLIGVLPLVAILEGCGQVHSVNRVRFLQATTGNLVVWTGIACGLDLWVAVASAVVRLAWELWLLFGKFGAFFRSLPAKSNASRLSWREEILPLQWRLAVRAVTSYFAFGLFVPVIFRYHGEVASGRIGMTWTALLALEAAALAWVQTRIPRFGVLAARRDWAEMDRIFFRLSSITCGIFVLGAACFLAVVASLQSLPFDLGPQLADRMLPVFPAAIFSLALFVLLIPRCQAYYIFAHKRDPYVWISVTSYGLAGPAVWWGGKHYGATGEAVGFLAVIVCFVLPISTWIWRRTRRNWHTE